MALKLKVDGASLAYQWIGEGSQILTLVNGYTRPSTDFRMLARRLSNHDIRCLLFDNRGAGETEVEREFDMSDMVGDIRSLWEHENITESALLGISMGGMIAQKAAAENQAVTKLILISTSCSALKENAGSEIEWSTDPIRVREKMLPYFSETFLKGNKLVVDAMMMQIAKKVETTDFIARAETQKKAIQSFDFEKQLKDIHVPTLIMHGDIDRIVDFEQAKLLTSKIPNSTLRVFENCGHLLLAEAPKELSQSILEFLT